MSGYPTSQSPIIPKRVTVPNGSSLTAAIPLGAGKPAGIMTPASLDSATSLTFQLSYDNGQTYKNMYSQGSEYAVTVGVDQCVPLTYSDFWGATHMKLRLGTSGSPTSATADRDFVLGLVP